MGTPVGDEAEPPRPAARTPPGVRSATTSDSRRAALSGAPGTVARAKAANAAVKGCRMRMGTATKLMGNVRSASSTSKLARRRRSFVSSRPDGP